MTQTLHAEISSPPQVPAANILLTKESNAICFYKKTNGDSDIRAIISG